MPGPVHLCRPSCLKASHMKTWAAGPQTSTKLRNLFEWSSAQTFRPQPGKIALKRTSSFKARSGESRTCRLGGLGLQTLAQSTRPRPKRPPPQHRLIILSTPHRLGCRRGQGQASEVRKSDCPKQRPPAANFGSNGSTRAPTAEQPRKAHPDLPPWGALVRTLEASSPTSPPHPNGSTNRTCPGLAFQKTTGRCVEGLSS